MNNPNQRLHPVLWVAAIALTAACVVAIAKMSGWIGPSTEPALANSANAEKLAEQDAEKNAAVAPAPSSKDGAKARATSKRSTAEEPRYSRSDARPYVNSYPAARHYCGDCGIVEAVRTVKVPAKASGVGAVAGGVVGGLLGHQVGEGSGKDVATVAGAVVGGLTGHQVEKHVRTTTHYEVDVTMADGTRRSIPYNSQPPWSRGDEVEVRNGVISAASTKRSIDSL